MGVFDAFTGRKALQKQVGAMQVALDNFRRAGIASALQAYNSSVAMYPAWDISQNSEKYCTDDNVYSIISLLVRTSAEVPVWAYDVKPDQQKNYKQLKNCRPGTDSRLQKAFAIKALEDLPETDKVAELLANPNTYQSQYEFLMMWYTWVYMQGEGFIFFETVDGGVNAGRPVAMHILDPQYVVLNVTSTFPQRITGYSYVVAGQKILDSVDPMFIMHIKYPNPTYSINGAELRGLSPLKVASALNVRSRSTMNATVRQLQNGGVAGIIYDETISQLAGATEAVEIVGQRKNDYSQFAQNPANVGADYFASGKLGRLEMGTKLADMQVVELEKVNFKRLCNIYHVSDRLFNNDATGSEISDDNARKSLYINATLPNVRMFCDGLNMALLPFFKDKTRYIKYDDSTIPELQENMKDLASWVNTCYVLKGNEKREMLRFDKDTEDPLMEQYIIPSGMMLLSDLASIDPANDILP